MSDVFLSYKREDLARVRRIYDALTRAHISVWWDREIDGGELWRARITRELASARCVVVVWSRQSVGDTGTFVREEASHGLGKGILLPVRIEPVDPPLGFGECQALDLSGWRGQWKDPRIVDLVATARAIVQGAARPRLLWPLARRRWRLFASALCTSPLAIALLIALLPVARTGVCTMAAARAACESLGYRAPVRSCFKWARRVQRLPYVVRPRVEPLVTEEAAKADALTRGNSEARGLACVAVDTEVRKLLAARLEVTAWQCAKRDDGYHCGFDGSAICEVSERTVATGADC
jgi:hypothetical protein